MLDCYCYCLFTTKQEKLLLSFHFDISDINENILFKCLIYSLFVITQTSSCSSLNSATYTLGDLCPMMVGAAESFHP